MSKQLVAERLRFVLRNEFADADLLCADDTPRTWTVFNERFAFAMLDTWQGHVEYRRRRWNIGPEQIFCCEPGEVHSAVPDKARIGSFKVLFVSNEAFDAQCRAEGLGGTPHFGQIVMNMTPGFGGALHHMKYALEGNASSLELKSCLALLVRAAIAEVIEPLPRPAARLPARSSIQQLRDLLHSEEGARVSLLAFAQNAGMSQYQLLRGFKRMYGLPPHAYELNVRVERARLMLRRGYSVAQAAAANDFTDQSHFTRHFRRIWGMTPGQYAR